MSFMIETSARHIHLTQETVEKLFGAGYQLTIRKPLSYPAQHRQSVYKGLVQLREYLRFGVLREFLSVVKIPRLGLKAVRAAVGAAGYEQRHPHADTVGNITFLQFSVMHGTTS